EHVERRGVELHQDEEGELLESRALGRAGIGSEPRAVAVPVGEVEGDRAALTDLDLAVREEGNLAARGEAQQLRVVHPGAAREDRARLVVEAELVQHPVDAQRARRSDAPDAPQGGHAADPSAPASRSAAISAAESPAWRSTSSVCWPSVGAGREIADGVASSRSAGRGWRMRPATGCSSSTRIAFSRTWAGSWMWW